MYDEAHIFIQDEVDLDRAGLVSGGRGRYTNRRPTGSDALQKESAFAISLDSAGIPFRGFYFYCYARRGLAAVQQDDAGHTRVYNIVLVLGALRRRDKWKRGKDKREKTAPHRIT